MSKTSNVLSKRREILFLYDVTDSNPNGDPDDANRPRMDEEGYNIVTDVRLKRTIRDYWDRTLAGTPGYGILVKSIVDEATADLKPMGKIVAETLGIDETKLSSKDSKAKALKKIINDVPAKFIDARCFGAAVTLKGASYSHVGPVQFAIGRSLNKPTINSFTITTTFASTADRSAGTFGEFHVVDYSLLLFHGIASEYTAKNTGMTDSDLAHLYSGLWLGTKLLNTRSKFNHAPRALLSVVAKKEHFQVGGLDRYIRIDKEDGIKRVEDVVLDMTALVDAIKGYAENLESIEFVSDPSVTYRYGKEESSDLNEILKHTGIPVNEIRFE